jgi:hypothetical protein
MRFVGEMIDASAPWAIAALSLCLLFLIFVVIHRRYK